MKLDPSRYRVKLAGTDVEREGAQRLRYRVFVEEMGVKADPADQAVRLERDAFDPWFDHLILLDETATAGDPRDRVVGAYRLMRDEAAVAGIGFYGASEYDLDPISGSSRRCVELGRSCVAMGHRRGAALHLLWNGLADYVLERGIEILFGVASFPGTDPEMLSEGLSFLHHRHLAPPELRARALPDRFVPMNRLPPEAVDPVRALRTIPPLIRAYLRSGGFVGEGACIDVAFNSVDVCVVMDTARMTEKHRAHYSRGRGGGA